MPALSRGVMRAIVAKMRSRIAQAENDVRISLRDSLKNQVLASGDETRSLRA
jgi:hypothetical protein